MPGNWLFNVERFAVRVGFTKIEPIPIQNSVGENRWVILFPAVERKDLVTEVNVALSPVDGLNIFIFKAMLF